MTERIIVLTGANRGLGRKTAEILLEKYSENSIFIFTERSKNHQELEEAFHKINPQAKFDFKDLDIASKESRYEFKNWFTKKYNKLDVLFNNAGVFNQEIDTGARPSKELAEFTIGVNFIGTVEFTEELYPLLTDDAKIIMISSQLGKLHLQPQAAQQLLTNEQITKEELFQLAHNFIESASSPNTDLIFYNRVYCTSKAFLNCYSRYIATKYIKPNQSVYAVHPGRVKTDMGGKQAPLTTEYACPFLTNIIAEFPYGRHPLSGLLQFENKDFGF